MRRRSTVFLTGFLLLSTLLPAGAGHAADIQERTLRFPSASNKGHPQVEGVEKFAELVEEKSGGKITVKPFPGGVLGPDLQTVSAMQGGTIDLTVMNASLLAGNVKEFRGPRLPVPVQQLGGSLCGRGRSHRAEAVRQAAREGLGRSRLL